MTTTLPLEAFCYGTKTQLQCLTDAGIRTVRDLFVHVADDVMRYACEFPATGGLYKRHVVNFFKHRFRGVHVDFLKLIRERVVRVGGEYPHQWMTLNDRATPRANAADATRPVAFVGNRRDPRAYTHKYGEQLRCLLLPRFPDGTYAELANEITGMMIAGLDGDELALALTDGATTFEEAVSGSLEVLVEDGDERAVRAMADEARYGRQGLLMAAPPPPPPAAPAATAATTAPASAACAYPLIAPTCPSAKAERSPPRSPSCRRAPPPAPAPLLAQSAEWRPDRCDGDDHHLCCPISLEPFSDPVMTVNGQTYDRASILEWWSKPGPITDPMTGLLLASTALTDNHSMRIRCGLASWA